MAEFEKNYSPVLHCLLNLEVKIILDIKKKVGMLKLKEVNFEVLILHY
jgi:hypothetical protein